MTSLFYCHFSGGNKMSNLSKNRAVSEQIKYAVITAMFAALITVTTAYIKIPAPLGYAHAGDSMIYLAASVLPGPLGFAAAAVGGGLADLLAGYPQWAIPTAIIKALNVLPFFLIKLALKNSPKLDKIISLPNLLMLIPTTIVTIGGYFVANALLYDTAAAIAEILPNLVQASVGAGLFIVLGTSLDAAHFKSRILSGRKEKRHEV